VLTDAEIEFLRSQLDEDEKAAVAAARADGRYGGRPHWSPLGTGMVTDSEDPDWAVVDLTPCIEDGDLAAHIARHDPARELREVEVKRKRLALYLDAKKTLAEALAKAPPEGDPATAHSYVRERINVNQASGRFTALEVSVSLDVAAYGGHRPVVAGGVQGDA
jgi:Family of unknown function (DUF6221)